MKGVQNKTLLADGSPLAGKGWEVTAEELADKAEEQRQRGRPEEALILARHATTLDPQDANAFWQLALCQLDLNRPAKAIEPLEKVTELAPSFANGWAKLGLALQTTGADDRAKACFENAITREPDGLDALNALASIYERDQQSDDEMLVLVALERLVDLTTYQLNRLGILHHNKGDFSSAIRYYQQVAAAGDPAGFFNLGLVYRAPEVGQHADAVDVWRRVLEQAPGHERAEEELGKLLPKVSSLRQRILALAEPVLDKDQWYSHYINPLELLRLNENEETGSLDPKVLQRAKKALLHEIQLEDGQIEWMPGLHIDRSQAIRICDELNDKTRLYYHYHISKNRGLSAFLQRGDLRHFLVDESIQPREIMALLKDDREGFGTWLSPRFAAQFDLVLTKAIEHRNILAVECLFEGRRWVQPEDEDKCFESAHRRVTRLLEPLREVADLS
jgi:tetratricopeptide (TPR) repeat protein